MKLLLAGLLLAGAGWSVPALAQAQKNTYRAPSAPAQTYRPPAPMQVYRPPANANQNFGRSSGLRSSGNVFSKNAMPANANTRNATVMANRTAPPSSDVLGGRKVKGADSLSPSGSGGNRRSDDFCTRFPKAMSCQFHKCGSPTPPPDCPGSGNAGGQAGRVDTAKQTHDLRFKSNPRP